MGKKFWNRIPPGVGCFGIEGNPEAPGGMRFLPALGRAALCLVLACLPVAPVFAQSAFTETQRLIEPDGSNGEAFRPQLTHAADLTGDGVDDIIALGIGRGSGSSDEVRWYANTTVGSEADFTAPEIIFGSDDFAVLNVARIHAADFDNDGRLDVIISDGNNEIRWHENRLDTSEGFAPGQLVATGLPNSASDLFPSDVDGDGDTDLVFTSFGTNFSNGVIAWSENRLNQGESDFAPFAQISALPRPVSVDAADLDNDGDPDVTVAAANLDRVIWFENNLNEMDTAWVAAIVDFNETGSGTTANQPSAVATADLDGDGWLDVIVAEEGDDEVVWHQNRLNMASADFAPQRVISAYNNPNQLGVLDADLDGDSDVLINGDSLSNVPALLYLNQINEAGPDFSAAVTAAPEDDLPEHVSVGSIDGDARLDVIVTSPNRQRTFWRQNMNTGPAGVSFEPLRAVNHRESNPDLNSVDLDGDGDLDLVTGGRGNIAWYENRLSGPEQDFSTQRVLSFAVSPFGDQSIAVGDIDQDGDPDIVFRTEIEDDEGIYWLENRLNELSGDFAPPALLYLLSVNLGNQQLYLQDIDGDSDLDLVTSNPAWFANRLDEPSADFGPPSFFVSGPHNPPGTLIFRDLDGDGDVDPLGSSNSGTFWYENQVDQGTGFVLRTVAGISSARVAYAPDGRLLVGADDSDGGVRVFDVQIGSSSGDFSELYTLTTAPNTPRGLAAADLGGPDGIEVVLTYLANPDSKLTRYNFTFPQENPGSEAPENVIGLFDGPGNLQLVDYSGDGDPDIVVESQLTLTLLLNSNNVPDLDGDGIPDTSDNCPNTPNANQANNDGDAFGDVCDPDDDNDGMSDTFENMNGLDPFDPNDADEDADNDGLSNLGEANAGTDPNAPDSDNDGLGDNIDAEPTAVSNACIQDGNGDAQFDFTAMSGMVTQCAAENSITVLDASNAVIEPGATLQLYSLSVAFDTGASVPLGAIVQTIIGDPTPSMAP